MQHLLVRNLVAARRLFANTLVLTHATPPIRARRQRHVKRKRLSLARASTKSKPSDAWPPKPAKEIQPKLLTTHLDGHIPYSQETLDLFKASPKFCQQQEREFRVFAADGNEKRLRFKPMQATQRAFLHALAEDFGLDSESQDPEPHRHVSVFKTPRFVSAPMKTLSQCLKIQAAPVAASNETSSSARALVANADPYNAFLLTEPRFGLTIDELHSDLSPEFSSASFGNFDISFLPSGDIVIKPLPAHFMSNQKLEADLGNMKISVSKKVSALGFAKETMLCAIDGSLNVLRREDESASGAGGWSQVAKGAGRKIAPVRSDVGVKSSFTVLGTKAAKKVKKESNEEAVDDWEREVEGAVLLVPGAVAQLYNTVIETAYGGVQGVAAFNSSPAGNISNWQDITVWRGIPFAASTSGSNRFRPPQNLTAWNNTLHASTFGGVCPQDFTLSSSLYYSEDCLNLNIWSAGNDTSAKLPVMLWSYPAESTAAQPLFDGAGMASKGFVFVNYNYRTGSLGWLATEELSREMVVGYGTNSSGNWGMLDQFAALKWVHANIASFGGDPDHITIMGQSAGSAATQHMLNSPLTSGLIVNAIIESGVRDPHDPQASSLAEGYHNLSVALTTGATYMSSLSASSIAGLRALPFEDLIVSFRGNFSFGAVLDYYAMPATYMTTLLSGLGNDVPILTGNTRDESGASFTENTTVSAYNASLISQYGSYFAAQFLALYPAANNSEADTSFNAHYRDTSRVGTWNWARYWKEGGKRSDVFTYLWDHAPPGQGQGAYHESEISYVLNNLYGTDLPWEAEDYVIAEKMSSYWANFARTGNPNLGGSYPGGNLSYFPSWRESSNTTMELGDGFWGGMPIAKPAQIALIDNFFGTQVPI
ncbi:hypothetical protein G7Y89_g8056 [Cudoniella acicularis]|uniref:R3H domain-containing protein n=1 Tax=Cudoniella acicularis TaxID=354080 RepID=A0A8H4W1G1_9HELO|nr:hypothetical protein G7Y89_g8056 [Cudoniella acicularis]